MNVSIIRASLSAFILIGETCLKKTSCVILFLSITMCN
ncbi:hypothetical protein LINPERPRIM_LOCUS6326 [Linum perenne]